MNAHADAAGFAARPSPITALAQRIRILAAEDDFLSMAFLEAQIEALGYTVERAENGREALEILARDPQAIDVVIMDRLMPVMDGLTAVRRMKDDPKLRNIPVVMVTGADSTEEMREGLDVGVFYYLTKPVEQDMLRSVLSAAVREAQQGRTLSEELTKHRASFDMIESCRFRFRTLDEAESLAPFIANCFPDPERVLPGLGELMVNAIEHGNLGIGYDTKTQLVADGIWRAEVNRLLRQPEFARRTATATIARKDGGVYVVIEDEGKGFEWKRFMTIDPARAGDNHGRGIAQANARSFDRLTYNDVGNKAAAFVSSTPPLEW